jgi:hypothetical protein
MRANAAHDDSREYAVPDHEDKVERALALELERNGIKTTASSAYAERHLECPTLIEHVVDFLEHYNRAGVGLR